MSAVLESHLTSVTVYPDRARLTRQGRAEFPAGVHKLEIGNLSARILPDSARVSAHGSARSRLLGLQVQRTFYSETPAEEIRRLEEQVEAAADDLSAIQAQVEALAQERTRLEALAGHTEVYATALAAGEQTVEAQLALFDRLRERSAALNAEALALEGQRRSQERRLKQLQQQLDQARSVRPRERYTAQVAVEVLQPGELSIELSYVVSGAGWKPLYDLRLTENRASSASSESEGRAALEVGYLAEVTQQSGEDWENVALTLSTARPALAPAVPELKPWYIQPYAPPRPLHSPAPGEAQMKEARLMMAEGAPRAAPPPQAEFMAEEAMASVEQSATSVSYAIPGAASIPPDGSAHTVVIARYPLPPALDYVSAPVMVPAVYRRARVTNASPYTLLPGKANLFAGDEFLGATRLELTAPGGEIELYLGVEDRIKVERELVRREVDKTIIGGKRRLHYGYEIKLENLLPAAASVVVRDQLPVARHEDIKVRLESIEPRPAKQNELNQVDWSLELEPGEKRVLRFDFGIEYPQTMELAGLHEAGPRF